MKSVKRDEIIKFLDRIYLEKFNENDYCHNGLQVEGSPDVTGIVLGVSFSQRLIEAALSKGANMIICHHGIFNSDVPTPIIIGGFLKNRLKELLSNDINLVGYHLPMDVNESIGHNVLACKKLELNNIRKCDLGYMGDLSKSVPLNVLKADIEKIYERNVQAFPFGKDDVKTVAVISGGGSRHYVEPFKMGADLFITGDMSEDMVRKYEEMKLNVINAGHYHTERLGIIELREILSAKYDISCDYIEVMNFV